jgi:lipopolysaccharide/colanic/teichoic acid biosynthesis glycosyltransferase
LHGNAHGTTVGTLLAVSGFAAVPELLNVLRGTMSLVGPPPLPAAYAPYYTPAQRRRHDMRPGLTGLAQTEGRSLSTWEELFARDIAYVDGFTFSLDCKIIARAIVDLFRGEYTPVPHGLPPFDTIVARREGAEDI